MEEIEQKEQTAKENAPVQTPPRRSRRDYDEEFRFYAARKWGLNHPGGDTGWETTGYTMPRRGNLSNL